MDKPSARLLGDGNRLHLQHGPIDLVIGVDAPTPSIRRLAFQSASRRFNGILTELVAELPLLKTAGASAEPYGPEPKGSVARRMTRATRPHAATNFVTPMAAVAGAVADEILHVLATNPAITRAYVNNGGDIALHLGAATQYAALISGLDGSAHGRIVINATTRVRGIATSGQGGRSLSFGIADSVTVLGQNAARADVAATLIANAVDLPGASAIIRTPARDHDPDSDLGRRLVVAHVGPLAVQEIAQALDAGARAAQTMVRDGLIEGAALFLRHSQRIIGQLAHNPTQYKVMKHA
ncbi:MAG: UPF0280 family protein [Rhodobacteraceae bacterium]|nr:UPF0280 family protein [Paracoccaceae bacterium]